VELCVKELAFMTDLCRQNVEDSFQAYLNLDLKELGRIQQREEAIDDMQEDITAYLVQLSRRDLADPESNYIPRLIHCVNDAERIGDHAINLIELAEQAVEFKAILSPDARKELERYYGLVEHQIDAILAAISGGSSRCVHRVLVLEGQINSGEERLIEQHIERLEKGDCSAKAGVLYLDVLANLEKIGDHVTNIAERIEASEE
jgi:phosphate:Na+ symporter